MVEAVREYAAARQANIVHGPLLSARKAAHDALLAALARLDAVELRDALDGGVQ